MKISFLDKFKRKPAKKEEVAPPVALAPVDKASSDRLSKTVLPNATRGFGAEDSGRGSSANGLGQRAPFSLTSGLPPAVALALEPKIERGISLDLADVLAQMPEGLTRPLPEGEVSRRVLLKAAEIEKGMSSGKPAVSVFSVFQQAPEIFLQKIQPSDERQVPLPFEKVMEQFSKLQMRNDQYRERTVPQVETPFLQLTLEDNTRFGTTMETIETGPLPPVRLEPATAEAIAAAEPEPALHEKIPLPQQPIPLTPLRPTAAEIKAKAAAPIPPPPIQQTNPPAPARIPFSIAPNGTDAPAERVPASSGPSVPTAAPKPAAPTRIPFKISAPSDEVRPKPEPWLTKESFQAGDGHAPATKTPAFSMDGKKPAPSPANGLRISLPLKPILQSLPPFQLTGDIAAVPDDAKIELPFSLVETQLVTGRIALQPEEFAAALPEKYRALFTAREVAAPVALSLQDVLKSLPDASLRMRDDQVEDAKGNNFITPFSEKAAEDEQRFTPATAPVPAAPAPNAKSAEQSAPKPIVNPAPLAAGERTALQEILETDDEVDAKLVVAHVGKLPGVQACAIMFSDGLSLAGKLPEEFATDGLCVRAPSLVQRVMEHMSEAKLGSLRAMTLFCEKASLSFFSFDNLCLAVLHSQADLNAEIRERLARTTEELSRKYSTPA